MVLDPAPRRKTTTAGARIGSGWLVYCASAESGVGSKQLGTFYRRGQLQECCRWKSADMERVITLTILESGILLRLNYSDRRM